MALNELADVLCRFNRVRTNYYMFFKSRIKSFISWYNTNSDIKATARYIQSSMKALTQPAFSDFIKAINDSINKGDLTDIMIDNIIPVGSYTICNTEKQQSNINHIHLGLQHGDSNSHLLLNSLKINLLVINNTTTNKLRLENCDIKKIGCVHKSVSFH